MIIILLSLLVETELFEPLEFVLINKRSLFGLLVRLFDLSQFLHKLQTFLFFFFELLANVLSPTF